MPATTRLTELSLGRKFDPCAPESARLPNGPHMQEDASRTTADPNPQLNVMVACPVSPEQEDEAVDDNASGNRGPASAVGQVVLIFRDLARVAIIGNLRTCNLLQL